MKIDKNYALPFPPDRVYDAWICPDKVVAPVTRKDINPAVGGHYRLIIETEDRCNRVEGLFFCVEPDRHIRFSWERDRDGEITQVDVVFDAAENGTALRISHSGFRSEESRDTEDGGWDHHVEQLGQLLEKSRELEPA